jgi:hypothetical protein
VYVDNGTPVWTPRFITEEPPTRPAVPSVLSRFLRGAAARMRARRNARDVSAGAANDGGFTRFCHGPRRRRDDAVALLFPWKLVMDPDGTPADARRE